MGVRLSAVLVLIALTSSAAAFETPAIDRSIKALDQQVLALTSQGRYEEALSAGAPGAGAAPSARRNRLSRLRGRPRQCRADLQEPGTLWPG